MPSRPANLRDLNSRAADGGKLISPALFLCHSGWLFSLRSGRVQVQRLSRASISITARRLIYFDARQQQPLDQSIQQVSCPKLKPASARFPSTWPPAMRAPFNHQFGQFYSSLVPERRRQALAGPLASQSASRSFPFVKLGGH